MSAEKEALEHLNQIFTIIKETLQDVNKERPNMRELTNEEKQSLSSKVKTEQILKKFPCANLIRRFLKQILNNDLLRRPNL